MNKFDAYLKERAKLVEKNLSKYISKNKNYNTCFVCNLRHYSICYYDEY